MGLLLFAILPEGLGKDDKVLVKGLQGRNQGVLTMAVARNSFKPLELRGFKGSLNGDIGPYEASIWLYWRYFGL